ncbi:MAG: cupin domain-containing protein [Gaiellaceae bacterium]
MFVDELEGRTLSSADSSFVIGSWRADAPPPGEPRQLIAPLHVHHRDDEAWYVLSGKLGFQLDSEAVEVGAGGGMLISARDSAHVLESGAGAGALPVSHAAADRGTRGRPSRPSRG